MTQHRDDYLAVISVLRLGCASRRDLSADELADQDRLYAAAMTRYPLEDVRDACLDWTMRSKWWPELAEMHALAQEAGRLRKVARSIKLDPPPAAHRPSAPMPVPSNDDLRAKWGETDLLFEKTIADPNLADYLKATLSRIHATSVRKRREEHPDLAAAYYDDPVNAA
jgi:hypothetical protein